MSRASKYAPKARFSSRPSPATAPVEPGRKRFTVETAPPHAAPPPPPSKQGFRVEPPLAVPRSKRPTVVVPPPAGLPTAPAPGRTRAPEPEPSRKPTLWEEISMALENPRLRLLAIIIALVLLVAFCAVVL